MSPPSHRLSAIDALRGFVMVVMALDHVRDFIHRGAMTASPTDLSTTTTALFLTRWVTHICAPVFLFTAGLGAYLWASQGRRRRLQLSWFLLTRGVWFVLLELTVMRLAYNFTFAGEYPVFLIVLWVLGLCLIGLSALVWLPVPLLAAISIATIVLHHLLDPIQASQFGAFRWAWLLLHQVGVFSVAGVTAIVAYPFVPWIAVMALGYCFGPIMEQDAARRTRALTASGLAALAGFVLLRAINAYGDPQPWATQPSALFTALSFLNTTKYPPSLMFLSMTLGPAFLLLAWFDRRQIHATHPLAVFGRVPLFYFVLHFYLAHAAAVLLAFVTYGAAAWSFVFHPLPSMGGPRALFPADFGYPLWAAYVVWAVVVLVSYPACQWFATFKARHRTWWIGYL